jgi:sarcosine oxidase subunit alpha
MNKSFFVGQRSLAILQRRPLRQQLVGFRLAGTAKPRVKEAHLIIDNGRIAGRVTSVALSPTLGYPIGLALVDPEVAKRGELQIRVARDEHVSAPITALPFYDESGDRQRVEEAA